MPFTPLNRIGLIERSYGSRLASRLPTGMPTQREIAQNWINLFLQVFSSVKMVLNYFSRNHEWY